MVDPVKSRTEVDLNYSGLLPSTAYNIYLLCTIYFENIRKVTEVVAHELSGINGYAFESGWVAI